MPMESNFTKDVNPSPVASIQMYSPKFKAPYRQKELPRNPTELEKKDFLNALKDADKYAIGLSLFSDFQEPFIQQDSDVVDASKLPRQFRELFDPKLALMDNIALNEHCKKVFLSLNITVEEMEYVEQVTRNQSASIIWHEQRTGRITGSIIHKVRCTSLDCPSKSLILSITNPGYNVINTPPLNVYFYFCIYFIIYIFQH
ncbi:uncharacterized protein LOC130623181 [Hydractinia symbiolongicarpus]|uniref:uncharacterized protein LOC130623181 n=1 Tax=Hydractinia symbiolongicarpus TaxID=13093 RepID=UPI00254E6BB4|nr:uncharacterized protein LOC130623181 [Hydractinia symbiolongicarpus]